MDKTENWQKTKEKVGWVDLRSATQQTYRDLGFKCGLEVHQQLLTRKKLFCRCPAGIYHNFEDYDAEIVRHMRPTLSELGEYDGTALMEFKTKKQIVYRIKNDTACTYEVDDTPPFILNPEALANAMEIALLLKMNIVGELHITRKQYLDGSIPTGFQRTTILGIEGSIPISNKTIKLIQFSIEEDSCREVSDIRHTRIYYADRLGMPLIETVTYPEMLTPQEALEAGQYIRFLARSSGKVRTGIGAARQDVNVSVTGGTRVEIKGVSHLTWIPKLTHNEAFRQKALLLIKDELKQRIADSSKWNLSSEILHPDDWKHIPLLKQAASENWKLVAVNLPYFKDLLSHFTQPGLCFADEFSDRLKVIPCLEKPNIFHSEETRDGLSPENWKKLAGLLKAGSNDAQILFWTPEEDLATALDTIRERCQLAFQGVPNETRKALSNGTTIFERVLPGADRMYPDTDSAPIPIKDETIEAVRKVLPVDLSARFEQLRAWNVPNDAYIYILRNNLMPVIENMAQKHQLEPCFIAKIYAHTLKSMQGRNPLPFGHDRLDDLFNFIRNRHLAFDVVYPMLKVLFENPNMTFSSVLSVINYSSAEPDSILEQFPVLQAMYGKLARSKRPDAQLNWIMGRLHKAALGNIPLAELSAKIDLMLKEEVQNA